MTNTIVGSVSIYGTGLHTGADTVATLAPGEPGEGIKFYRVDLPGDPEIRATLESVVYTQRRTVLGNGVPRVATVEHLLAAIHAHRLDDISILMDGPEVPQADGSAQIFTASIAEAGVVQQDGSTCEFIVHEEFEIEHNGALYQVYPADCFEIDVSVEWDHPVIGAQSFQCIVSPHSFDCEFAGARTFGFLEEMDKLRDDGLIGGVTEDSVIALSADGIVHGGPLRWQNEFARHKALDLVGDLALLGGQLTAKIVARRPSHGGNIALGREIQTRAERVAVQSAVVGGTIGKVADGD